MRFVLHGSNAVRLCKIDWDTPVALSAEIRAAMAPHDLERMRRGVLQKGSVVNDVTYPRGTLAFRVAAGHETFLQAPGEDAPRAPVLVATPIAVPAWTVEAGVTEDRHRVVVDHANDGERVDLILASLIEGMSRAVAQRLLEEGRVTVAGLPIKKNQRLRPGDLIEVVVARPPIAR